MPRVAILQHEPSVPPGLIESVLVDAGVGVILVKAWTGDVKWPSTQDIDGLVVLGGTMNVDQLDEYPFLRSSRALMSEAMDRRIPTLGVCLGSQMMARVLDEEVRRADKRNALFSRLELTSDGASDPLIEPFADVDVLQFHEDTFAVPDKGISLASSSSSGLAQAFRVGENAYAVQFHFEVDRSILEGWLRNIGRWAMLDDWGCSEGDLLGQADRFLAAQNVAGRALVRGFLGLVAAYEGQEWVGTKSNL